MRKPAKKFVTILLALAVGCLPLQAFACDMHKSQDQDHAGMVMPDANHVSHAHKADADCCKLKAGQAPTDCAQLMNCSSCATCAALISPIPQRAAMCMQLTAADRDTGDILPSHSSPPYHPPTVS